MRYLQRQGPLNVLRAAVATRLLFVWAAVLLAAGLLLAFIVAPTDASSMGFSQKIFYFHVSIAETALVAYAVAAVSALLFLRRREARYDRLSLAAVRLGLLFSALVMATGMIWGKAAWGVWWAWEPRLSTFLVALLLYGAYLVVRAAIDDEARRATVAAVFSIFAFMDVPITFFATRFQPEGLHPVVFTSQGAGMDGVMLSTFIVCTVGMIVLLAAMLRLELLMGSVSDELRESRDVSERGLDL